MQYQSSLLPFNSSELSLFPIFLAPFKLTLCIKINKSLPPWTAWCCRSQSSRQETYSPKPRKYSPGGQGFQCYHPGATWTLSLAALAANRQGLPPDCSIPSHYSIMVIIYATSFTKLWSCTILMKDTISIQHVKETSRNQVAPVIQSLDIFSLLHATTRLKNNNNNKNNHKLKGKPKNAKPENISSSFVGELKRNKRACIGRNVSSVIQSRCTLRHK